MELLRVRQVAKIYGGKYVLPAKAGTFQQVFPQGKPCGKFLLKSKGETVRQIDKRERVLFI